MWGGIGLGIGYKSQRNEMNSINMNPRKRSKEITAISTRTEEREREHRDSARHPTTQPHPTCVVCFFFASHFLSFNLYKKRI